MRIDQFAIAGLGHLSTLVADEDAGTAAIIDPRRDIDIYLDRAESAGLRITHVLETHLHNDYVSGGRELAASTGATHVIGAGADLAHDHLPVRHGDEIQVGSIAFRVLDTAGHTPEHVSYAVTDRARAAEPMLMLTGGSLLVGAVGRTDLLGVERGPEFAAAMHRSLHEVILRHEDSVLVYPTHGAGSLCSTGISSMSLSTIGFERRHDPLLALDVDAFARALLSGQPTVPRYFARMRPVNQAGPPLVGRTVPPIMPVGVASAIDRVAAGALVIDARSPSAHTRKRVAKSLNIPAGSSFGTWLGWVVDPDRPVVLIVERLADLDDLARQALRIGFDGLIGYIDGGLAAWEHAGEPIDSGGRLDVEDLARSLATDADERPIVIDVRQATEFEAGHVPGSLHITAGSLGERLDDLPIDHPIVAICASGYRASVAASMLRAAGFEHVEAIPDGVPAWADRGYPLEYGPTAEPTNQRWGSAEHHGAHAH